MTSPIPAELFGDAPISDQALESFLEWSDPRRPANEPISDPAASEVERWRVTDQGSAEWAARKLSPLLTAIAEAEALASEWHAQVDAWLKAQTGRDRRRAEFFSGHLTDYARRCREENESHKTLRTTCVTVSTTGYEAKAVVEDADSVVLWLQSQGLEEALKVEVRTAELNKLVAVEAVKERVGWAYTLTCGCEVREEQPDEGPYREGVPMDCEAHGVQRTTRAEPWVEERSYAVYRPAQGDEADPVALRVPGLRVEAAGFHVGKPKLV